MTNEEWIVKEWKKFTEWYAKRIWWFELCFIAIVTTVFILGAKVNSDLFYLIVPLMVLFGVCSGYGIAKWLELEHKE